mmetsp:Transcript_19498/g.44255  ORF Transcript_19498/g.44255 Transcript_19498/m.44255 type:complete len:242 (+) Transcript_19498:105-830(+)
MGEVFRLGALLLRSVLNPCLARQEAAEHGSPGTARGGSLGGGGDASPGRLGLSRRGGGRCSDGAAGRAESGAGGGHNVGGCRVGAPKQRGLYEADATRQRPGRSESRGRARSQGRGRGEGAIRRPSCGVERARASSDGDVGPRGRLARDKLLLLLHHEHAPRGGPGRGEHRGDRRGGGLPGLGLRDQHRRPHRGGQRIGPARGHHQGRLPRGASPPRAPYLHWVQAPKTGLDPARLGSGQP